MVAEFSSWGQTFKNSVEKCKSSGIKKSKLSSILEKIYGSEDL